MEFLKNAVQFDFGYLGATLYPGVTRANKFHPDPLLVNRTLGVPDRCCDNQRAVSIRFPCLLLISNLFPVPSLTLGVCYLRACFALQLLACNYAGTLWMEG
jgi:hypothetical protein